MKYQYREARTPRTRGKELDHIEIRKNDDGSRTVTHNYKENGLEFHKAKNYDFAPDEIGDFLEHVRRHSGVELQEPDSE